MDGPQYRYTRAGDTADHLRACIHELDVVAKRPSHFFYDREDKLLYIHTSDGNDPALHEIELIRRRAGIVTFGKQYITVKGFTFRHMRVAGINFERGSDNCIAVNNTSYGAWQGIRVYQSTNVLVRGNTLFRNGNSGIYFFGASIQGAALDNILYENSKGVRWSSHSANGLAQDNVAFAHLENGISIEHSDDVHLSRNVLVDNAASQLRVRKSRYTSDENCFERHGAGQWIAQLGHYVKYKTLAEYQQAANQDLSSREDCGPLPARIDLHRLHAETQLYAERARKLLAMRSKESIKRERAEAKRDASPTHPFP